MLTLRRAQERGHADHGWLDTHHTFSFGSYHDPAHMGFRTLRVLNDDVVEPGQGFGTHGHRDMEIVSYVVEGELAHRDSMGTGSTLRPGDVQRMTAGRGVTHSEFNGSDTDRARFLQIWIHPDRTGLEPEYEEKHFGVEERTGRLRLIASPGGEEGSLRIHQDVRIHAGLLDPGTPSTYDLAPGRGAWVQVVRGQVDVNGVRMERGDGLRVEDESRLVLEGDAELLLLDVA